MEKKFLWLIAIKVMVLLISILFFSCNKDKLTTPSERLVGKWREVQYATDDNYYGVLEPWELNNVKSGYIDEIAFYADSSGIEFVNINGSKNSYAFTWVLFPDGSIVRYGVGHDTLVYTIQNISAISLTLQTNNNFGMAWYVYSKE